jgi:hypothetical protein
MATLAPLSGFGPMQCTRGDEGFIAHMDAGAWALPFARMLS